MVKTITVVGAGNVGATTAQRIAEKHLARARRHGGRRRGNPAGQSARPTANPRRSRGSTPRSSARTTTPTPPAPTWWSSPPASPASRGCRATTFSQPMPASSGRSSEEIKSRSPERDPRHRVESARRDVLRREEGHRLPARAGDRHGRRAGHGALSRVPRRKRSMSPCATSRRWCSVATATRWSR